MQIRTLCRTTILSAACLSGTMTAAFVAAEPSNPSLETVFPSGSAAGTSVDVTLTGSNLGGLRAVHVNIPGCEARLLDANRCRIAIPSSTPPGLYDLWAYGEFGVSNPRRFFVSHRTEQLEQDPNDTPAAATPVDLNSVVNGRTEQPGDQDYFRFDARQGQRVVLECFAERIDSRLRAVLEVFDVQGRRLAVNRGYDGIDPLIDFRVPADGTYLVRIQDLISSGGADSYYRLDIDAGPRVAFAVPNLVPRGQASRVTLFGWNLSAAPSAAETTVNAGMDQLEVEIPASLAQETWPLTIGSTPAQIAFAGFPYHLPGSHAAIAIGVTDLPIVRDDQDNHAPATAQPISFPCEISGRLVGEDERDWFAIVAHKGEILHFDVLSQRLAAPTDPELSIFNSAGKELLFERNDEVPNLGGVALPTSHLDPSGRWVVPADGRYLILIRNLSSGPLADPRRAYRLSLRREEPDYQLVMVPRSAAPSGLNLRRGGREAIDVLALRRRGMNDIIRVSATGLPTGIDCPDIFLGPGVERATLVLSAEHVAADQFAALALNGHSESVGKRPVRGSTVIRAGAPNGWSRLTSEVPLAVAGEAPVRITATISETIEHHLYGKLRMRHAPGTVVDVAIEAEQRNPEHRPEYRIAGRGLPPGVRNPVAVIPRGEQSGHLSFYLPETMPAGRYSLAITAETTVPLADGKQETVTICSNPVSFTVEPAAFLVEVDSFAPRKLKRGETVQLKYSVDRRNGFIGKVHTELAAPGVVTNVPGLRGRGETFVGQSDRGSLQIVVNDDAPLGPQPFLRLFSVGVVEDQAIYQGAGLFPVEIVE